MQRWEIREGYFFGKLVGVSTVSIHVAQGSWQAPVTKQMHQFVNTLGIADVETALIRTS